MKLGKQILATILATLLLVTLFASCSKKPGTDTDNTPAVENAYPGTTGDGIVVNLGAEPPKMNTILTTDTTSQSVLRHCVEGLTRLDATDAPIAGIAEKWESSTDGLTWTFHLRDAKWSNGDAVTANDFVFSWMTLLDPKTAAEYNYMGYIFKNGKAYNEGTAKKEDVAIKAIDDKTLEFTLETPVPYLLSLLAYVSYLPVDQTAYETIGGTGVYGTEFDKMVYNGPYTITSWQHDSELVIEKNNDYYGASEIDIPKITFKMILDSSTWFNAFQAGELDMINLVGDQTAQLKTDANVPLSKYSDGSSWDFAFNLTDPTLANVNVRKALTLAIDRQSFVTNVRKDSSNPAFNWTSPDVNNGDVKFVTQLNDGKPYLTDNDVEGAKAALEQAKKDLGVDTIKVDMLADDTSQAKLFAAYFQEAWKNIGVDATVTTVPHKDRLDRQTKKQYQVSLYGWGPDYNDPMTFLDLWTSESGNNIIGLKDATYDDLIAKAKVEVDYDKRTDMLKQCEDTLMKNFYLGPIYFRQTDYVCSAKFTGAVRTTFQDMNFRWAKMTTK